MVDLLAIHDPALDKRKKKVRCIHVLWSVKVRVFIEVFFQAYNTDVGCVCTHSSET